MCQKLIRTASNMDNLQSMIEIPVNIWNVHWLHSLDIGYFQSCKDINVYNKWSPSLPNPLSVIMGLLCAPFITDIFDRQKIMQGGGKTTKSTVQLKKGWLSLVTSSPSFLSSLSFPSFLSSSWRRGRTLYAPWPLSTRLAAVKSKEKNLVNLKEKNPQKSQS